MNLSRELGAFAVLTGAGLLFSFAGCAAATGSPGSYQGVDGGPHDKGSPAQESPPPSSSSDTGGSGSGSGSGSNGSTSGSGGTSSGGSAVDAGGTPPDAAPAVDAAPSIQCGAGKTDCGGTCVSVDDPNFGCGSPSCGACGAANGTAGCAQGQCVMVSCNQNWANCNGDPAGCTTDLTSDQNCGGCGNQCGVQSTQGHAFAKCLNAPLLGPSCIMVCDPGWSDCNNDPSDGCEVHTDSDPYNCGGCGNDCTLQGYTSCVSGSCQ